MNQIKYNKEAFNVYSYNSKFKSGEKLRVEREIRLKQNDESAMEDMKNIIALGSNKLDELQELLQQQEKEAKEAISKAMDVWEDIAKQIALINACQTYIKTNNELVIKTTNNQWVQNESFCDQIAESISNDVYSMYVRVYEKTTYDRVQKMSVPVAWHVSWYFYVTSPIGKGNELVTKQERKVYTDKEKAIKYIEGRKKAYSQYFTEQRPAIPQNYKSLFMCEGSLLEGFTVAENEI